MRALKVLAMIGVLLGTLTAHADYSESRRYVGSLGSPITCSIDPSLKPSIGTVCFHAPDTALGHSVHLTIVDDYSAQVAGYWAMQCSYYGGPPGNCPGYEGTFAQGAFCDGSYDLALPSVPGIDVEVDVSPEDPSGTVYDCGFVSPGGVSGTITATWREG